MLIRFAQAEVGVLGSGLKSVKRDLQEYELKFVKSAPAVSPPWRTPTLPPSPSLSPRRLYKSRIVIKIANAGKISRLHDHRSLTHSTGVPKPRSTPRGW
jgi:hypothetical protein